MSADELQKSPASSWGAVNDKLREALELIRWSNDSKWQAQCAAEALAADDAEKIAQAAEQSAAFQYLREQVIKQIAPIADDAARGTMRQSERAEWFAVAMNAAACIEDAANCLRDEDAWLAAECASKHVREKCNALWQAATRAAAPQSAEPAPTDAEWEAEHLRLVRSYGKVCWVAGAGGDAIACLAISDALGAVRAHLSTRPQQADDGYRAVWLEQVALNQKLCAAINSQQAPTEADRLDAERYRWLRDVGDSTWASMGSRVVGGGPVIDKAIDAAMSAQAGGKEKGS